MLRGQQRPDRLRRRTNTARTPRRPARPVRLIWLAAHRDHATFTARAGLDYEPLLRTSWARTTLDRFAAALRDAGLDPDDYLLIPVHPWQWWNKLAVTFAAEVARRQPGAAWARRRTSTWRSSPSAPSSTARIPRKHYVKTALSVLNMGFMRGLSAAYMEATPAINDWLAQLVERRPGARATGLSIIRERAAVGYRHLEYEAAHRPLLAVPQDARRAVAGEPGADAAGRASGWRRWPPCCTWTATAGRSPAR